MTVGTYFKDHIWLPVLIGVVLFAALLTAIYRLFKCCSNRKRYDYTPLEEDMALPVKMEREREAQRNEQRDTALIDGQFYLRSVGKYRMIEQLNDIGSRCNKDWFMVKPSPPSPSSVRLLMTLSSINPDTIVPLTSTNTMIMMDMFTLMKHPHIQPITYFDTIPKRGLVVTMQPYAVLGSLKDFIYKSQCLQCWTNKYNFKSAGLTHSQVHKFGKQVLAGLLFLQENGFPSHIHLHSGNVMLVDSVCRLTGFENMFLETTSKLHPLLRQKFKRNPDSIGMICFGHLLYEMSLGRELNSPHPADHHIVKIQQPHIREILRFIFDDNGHYPTLAEVYAHSFFLGEEAKSDAVDLKNVHIKFSPEMKNILRSLRKGNQQRWRKSNVPNTSAVNNISESSTKTKTSKSTRAKLKTSSRRSSRSNPTVKVSNRIPAPPRGGAELPPPLPPPPPFVQPLPPPSPCVKPPPPSVAVSGERTRTALFGDIRKGMTLKKAVTVDKSGPRI